MGDKKGKIDKKKIYGLISLILVIALITGSSLAWRDVTQHKSNEFEMTSVQNNVTLAKNFGEVNSWAVDQTIAKEVSVRCD